MFEQAPPRLSSINQIQHPLITEGKNSYFSIEQEGFLYFDQSKYNKRNIMVHPGQYR